MKRIKLRVLTSSFSKIAIATSLALCQMLALPQLVHASTVDTCTWIGTTGLAATPSNWSCSTDGTEVPSAGDNVVFPDTGSPTKTVVIDGIAALKSISITGTSYDFTRTDGTVIALAGSGVSIETTQDATFDVPVTLGNSTLENMTLRAAAGKTLLMNGAVALDTGAGEINIGTSGQTGGVNFVGNVTGTTSQFIATNGATVRLAGAANTFTAATVGAESLGYFDCSNVSCFGNSANHIYTGGGTVVVNVGSHTYAQPFETSSPGSDPSTLEINASDVTFSSAMTLNDDLTVHVDAGGSFLPGGAVALGANTLTYTTDSGAQVQQNNVISGVGGNLVVNGYVAMNNNNTYTGATTITANGRLISSVAQGMGTTAGATTIQNGGTLQYNPFVDVTDAENISVEGDGTSRPGAIEIFSADKTATLSGTITLTGNTTISNSSAGTAGINFSGAITGTGNLTFVGDPGVTGTFRFSGSSANTYVGTTYINAARLRLSKTANVIAVPGDVVATAVPAHTSYLVVESDEQIADNSSIAVDTDASIGGLVITGNHHETVGTVTGDGLIQLGAIGDSLAVGGGNKSGTFTGQVLAGTNFVLSKVGTGTWAMNGTNWDLGGGVATYQIDQGTLSANFADASGAGSKFDITNGTLAGTGIVGNTTAVGGAVSPGNSPGCLYPTSLLLDAGTNLNIQIDGSIACTGYDVINSAGAVTLDSAAILNVTLGYTPTIGTTFTIVRGSSVSGTFAGLANGATITSNGRTLRVNYTATTVTLTDVGAAASASLANTGDVMPATLLYSLSGSSLLGIVEVFRRSKIVRYKVVR